MSYVAVHFILKEEICIITVKYYSQHVLPQGY